MATQPRSVSEGRAAVIKEMMWGCGGLVVFVVVVVKEWVLEMLEEREGETNCQGDCIWGETLSLQWRNKTEALNFEFALNSFVFVDLSFLS